jgi:amino acid adenylation domain-containing protein
LVEQTFNEKAVMTSSAPDLQQLPAQEVVFFPASFAQQRLWFLDQLTPGRATYNIDSALRIQGKLDVGVLERALQDVARRHETLRTRFVAAGGELHQVIEDQVNVQLPVLDLTGVAGQQEREAEAMRLAREEAQAPFNLKQAPLFRGKLLRLGALNHVLLFTMHHIISDAWSMGVLVEEISVLYGAFSAGQSSPLPDLPIQYADYTVWQRECLEGGLLEPQLAYWKQQLAEPSILKLPTDLPRPISQSQNGATCSFVMDANLTQGLKKLAEEQGATLFMVLLAAFQTLLYRYSDQDDIAVGTPIAGRRSSETEKLIGLFINTLVLRGDLSGAPSFVELLQRTKEITLQAYAHQDVPFEKLVEVLSPERNLGSTPLFQVMIGLQNAPQPDLQLGAATLEPFDTVDNGTSKFDLLLQLGEDGFGKLTGSLQYDTDLFDAASMSRLIDHYRRLLNGIVDQPTQSIDVLPLLTTNERKQVIEEWNRTTVEFPRKKCLPGLIEEQVARTPKAIAVEHQGRKLTYRELNERANQLARRLRELGVGLETRVGLLVERSLEMVVGLLGVLKAGAAYVPLDPDYPPERLRYMLESSQVKVLLTQERLHEKMPPFSGPVLELDGAEERARIAAHETGNLDVALLPQHGAYVIYTSGSTGRPKGAVNTHSGLLNRLLWMQEEYRLERGDVVLQKTPFSFDVSVWEFFWPLIEGAKLVVARPGGHQDPDYLATLIDHQQITTLHFVPSMLAVFLDEERPKQCKSIRRVVCSGEALPPELARRCLAAMPWAELHNLYGPTEAAIDVTYWKCMAEDTRASVPIGKAIANMRVYVVDKRLEPVPVGVPGELCLGGVGLARGYWGRGDWTAERFVPDGLSGRWGERLYRTGDMVRWLADGNLEYLGRIDHQVKIRGFRIELGEIEAALQEHESVHQAVVIARQDEGEDKRLVAYVVLKREGEKSDQGSGRVGLGINDLREHLLGKLPEYMVPSAYVQLEKIPLNHNGKIDRKCLPKPDKDIREQEYVGPRNATEETLCRLWQEVLRRERVGVHDNFFNIGGHSLLAVQVISRIKLAFSIEMPLSALFTAPTVARMAEHIAAVNGLGRPQSSPVLVNIQPHGSLPPFFCVHAVGGQVISYGELSLELGQEQPLYGLQSPPASLFPSSDVRIEQIAALYNREIRSVQPVGPYLLAGWSMGGLIAWEMARQMVAEGERISLLALIDTTPPSKYLDANDRVDEMSMLARFALDISQVVGRDPTPLAERFSHSTEQDQWNMVQDALISYGVLTPMTARAEMTGLLDVFTRNFLAVNNYSLHYSQQPVVFFRASETPERLSRLWTRWAGGGIQFHSVPGDHFTMLRRPGVRIIAQLLQEYMLKAGEQPQQVHVMSAEAKLT